MATAPSPPQKSRRADIETLRAIACIALVSYHAVGNNHLSGLELPASHWLRRLNDSLVDMRMPLFSFISGFVFVAISTGWRDLGRKLHAKTRRLLLPMLSVGALFWLARHIHGHDQQPLWTILFFPYVHFWFLQATALIMAALLVTTRLCGSQDRLAASLLLAGAAVWWLFLPLPAVNLFSIRQALYLTPFFMTGYLLAQFHKTDLRARTTGAKSLCVVALLAAAAAGFALSTGWLDPSPVPGKLLGLLIGLTCCLGLYALRPVEPHLARIGGYSYAIYLFHVFFTAAVTESMKAVFPGITPSAVYLLSLTAGLFGPIALERLLSLHWLAAGLFLGVRFQKRPYFAAGTPATR